MDIDPQNNFVFPILKAGENAYSINLKNDNIYSNGNHIIISKCISSKK